MKNGIIYTALGFGVGTLVGWAITADIYENRVKEERAQYDELLKDKTEHIWALQDRLDNPVVENAVVESSDAVKEPKDIVVEDQKASLDTMQETIKDTRSNLQSLIDRYTADPEAQAEFAELTAIVEDSENEPPFVISRDTYAYDDDGQYYAKITLTYYPRDRVLLDDDDEPMDNIAGIVGWRNLSRFGDQSEDPEVVFVRNRKMETDFEIVKEEEAPLPLHVKYGMEKEEFRANKAAGLIKLRQEDE